MKGLVQYTTQVKLHILSTVSNKSETPGIIVFNRSEATGLEYSLQQKWWQVLSTVFNKSEATGLEYSLQQKWSDRSWVQYSTEVKRQVLSELLQKRSKLFRLQYLTKVLPS